jgi:hypothetical protein
LIGGLGETLKFDYSPLLAAGRKSNLIKILSKEKCGVSDR